jgi:hypothetical protein
VPTRSPRDAEPFPRELPRPERLRRILERDGAECVWCRRPLAPGGRETSLEHVIPRLKGGPAWPENEVGACRTCNRRRGHQAPAAWLDDCEARGLEPRRDVVVASLLRLRAAIAERGGQRRARPYLDGQLRRLGLA